MKVHAVLLVPEPGGPHGLLKEGPCGARPPLALRRTYPRVVHEESWEDTTCPVARCAACGQPWPCDTPGRVESEGHVRWKPCNRHSTVAHALVLRWGGKPVAEGMDRAARMHPEYTGAAWASSRALGREMERLGYGTLVLLDAEGREVNDE